MPHSTLLCLHVDLQFFHTHCRPSSGGKAAGDVPIEDNPAYGVVSVYDNVQE